MIYCTSYDILLYRYKKPTWVTSFHFYDVLSYSIPLAFLYIVNRMYSLIGINGCVTS